MLCLKSRGHNSAHPAVFNGAMRARIVDLALATTLGAAAFAVETGLDSRMQDTSHQTNDAAAALPERPPLAATPTNRVSGTKSLVAISVAHENYGFEAVTPFPLLTNRFFLNQDGETTLQVPTSSGGAAICIRPEKIEEAEHAIECQPAEQDSQGNWGQSDHGYQISVRFAKQSFVLGEPIIATVIFRNLTNGYLSAPVSLPRFDTQVLVTNQKGEPLRPKEEEASGLNEFQKKLRKLIQDPKYFHVMPRAQVKLQVNINDLFEFTAPQVYHVQIRYSNMTQNGFGEVHSGSATIRIVPG